MHTYPHTQILHATKDSPLLIAKYPMFYGGYCPHIFYHEVTRRKTHGEAIYCASWNKNRMDPITNNKSPGWSLPKLRSTAGHSICLLFVDSDPTSENNGLPIIQSIYINALTTLQEVFQFASNPNYIFSGDQKTVLMQALLKRCTSDSPEFLHINNMWSYYHPDNIANIPNPQNIPT